MKRLTALASGMLLAVAASADRGTSAGWRRYTDAHGSSLEVPTAFLQLKRHPTSLVFVANDAARVTFETITEARPGFPGNDPEDDMVLKQSDCTAWPPAYQVMKENIAAYSCVRGSTVVYYVARYNGSGSVVLRATYPSSHSPTWDKLIARISASMRQVHRIERQPG